jgi:hypothetical protein
MYPLRKREMISRRSGLLTVTAAAARDAESIGLIPIREIGNPREV